MPQRMRLVNIGKLLVDEIGIYQVGSFKAEFLVMDARRAIDHFNTSVLTFESYKNKTYVKGNQRINLPFQWR